MARYYCVFDEELYSTCKKQGVNRIPIILAMILLGWLESEW